MRELLDKHQPSANTSKVSLFSSDFENVLGAGCCHELCALLTGENTYKKTRASDYAPTALPQIIVNLVIQEGNYGAGATDLAQTNSKSI